MFAGSRRNAGGLLDPLEVPLAPPDGDDLPVRVASGVVAPILLLLVEAPVGVEVPAAPQGPEAEDRFGPRQTPAGPGAVHPILDQVPAGPFDHAGPDRQALREGPVVAEVRGVLQQVVRAAIDARSRLRGEPLPGGAAPHPRRDVRGAAPQDAEQG